ncbi:MAG: Fe-S cluster assembly protein SufD [Verrucomicrobiales bacterium]|nr:Fe-S cluster assembly protein SufD [Verrucomicrobiales bacterium]
MTQTEESVWIDAPPVQDLDLEMPEWYQAFQKASWDRFRELPVATRKDEDWRYADLKKSRFEKLYPVQSATVPGTVDTKPLDNTIAHFVFVNGELVDFDVSNLPDGLICAPINNAISEGGDRLKPYFDVDAKRLGDEKFAALNGAATNYGIFVYAPKNLEVDGSIFVQHYVSGESAPVFPRTLIIADNNAKVSVIERFESLDDSTPGLSVGVCDLHADHGGIVQHVLVQDLNKSSKQVHLGTSRSGKDSSIKSVILNLGSAWTRNESINRMTEDGANTKLYGANLANELQEFDQRTLQIHDAQHTTSDLLIKNALYDKSRVIFGGLIQVLPGAHHTDSYQSCRNLIGSEEAEINAMPGLEIDADQVRCSHGATSGQISDEEIFYLRSRGIPTDEARRIVSCGFLAEAFSKIENPQLVEWLSGMIADKFDSI